ncbi:hypothetical protein L6V77_03750 [Myxococcota bacterium]|nr:hypothetical protein [Myxococcota bacterium]
MLTVPPSTVLIALVVGLGAPKGPLAPVTAAPTSPGPAHRGWAPEQATGPADTPRAGDAQTAWATWQADAPGEWLELTYDRLVPVAEIQIHENDKPGAIARVLAGDGTAPPVVVFEGPYSVTGERNLLKIRAGGVPARLIRIELASERVPGWNEIDAVELIGVDGTRQWATGARASSSYADGAPPEGTARLVGKRTTLHLVNGTALTGTVERVGPETIDLTVDRRTLSVMKTAVMYFERP